MLTVPPPYRCTAKAPITPPGFIIQFTRFVLWIFLLVFFTILHGEDEITIDYIASKMDWSPRILHGHSASLTRNFTRKVLVRIPF